MIYTFFTRLKVSKTPTFSTSGCVIYKMEFFRNIYHRLLFLKIKKISNTGY